MTKLQHPLCAAGVLAKGRMFDMPAVWSETSHHCVCVCVCVCEREREREQLEQ